MITLRCTQKLQKYLGVGFVDVPELPTAKLGDWYANLIPTLSGDLIVFVNEKSLLTVAIPVWESNNLLPLFSFRVAHLLGMIGIPPGAIEEEVGHFDSIQFAKTASRSILGTMNEMKWYFQIMAEDAKDEKDLSLSNAELELSRMIWKRQNYQYPSDVARELLLNEMSNAC